MIRHHLASLDSLQEGVMYFACDASAFSQTFVEAGAQPAGDLSHPQTVNKPNEENAEREHREDEPAGLIEVRLLRDAKDHSLPVPDAISIARANAQRMCSDRNVAVDRVWIRCSGVQPLRVHAVQPVLQTNFFGGRNFDRGESDLDMIRPRWQHNFVAGLLRVPTDRHVFKIDRRLRICDRQATKIEY